jgi:hypothetical protein
MADGCRRVGAVEVTAGGNVPRRTTQALAGSQRARLNTQDGPP